MLEYEVEHLLKREWLCIGRADELPTPGDYFTYELLGEPLLVVRGDDAAIRVLSNVCRHRGMLVADTPLGGRRRPLTSRGRCSTSITIFRGTSPRAPTTG